MVDKFAADNGLTGGDVTTLNGEVVRVFTSIDNPQISYVMQKGDIIAVSNGAPSEATSIALLSGGEGAKVINQNGEIIILKKDGTTLRISELYNALKEAAARNNYNFGYDDFSKFEELMVSISKQGSNYISFYENSALAATLDAGASPVTDTPQTGIGGAQTVAGDTQAVTGDSLVVTANSHTMAVDSLATSDGLVATSNVSFNGISMAIPENTIVTTSPELIANMAGFTGENYRVVGFISEGYKLDSAGYLDNLNGIKIHITNNF